MCCPGDCSGCVSNPSSSSTSGIAFCILCAFEPYQSEHDISPTRLLSCFTSLHLYIHNSYNYLLSVLALAPVDLSFRYRLRATEP